ncbi:MAG TPA: STAS domain-containing protein [Armatimonadota bacterium]|nr:STAS domain-containing protein [Armatimonadota bacterium]
MSKASFLFTELLDHAGDLDIQIRWQGGIPIIDVKGDVDKFTCTKLRQTIHKLLQDGERQIVIRMENVDYIDSSGLGSLVRGFLSVSRENGELAISGASPRVRKALAVTGLSSLIPLLDDEAVTLGSLTPEEELPLAA